MKTNTTEKGLEVYLMLHLCLVNVLEEMIYSLKKNKKKIGNFEI
jgi:hypothetical protein